MSESTRPDGSALTVGLPPVTVVVGDEDLLVQRAVAGLLGAAQAAAAGTSGGQQAAPPLDVHDVRADELGPADLAMLTAPSLFGGGCVVIIRSAQDASKEVAAQLLRYAAVPDPDVFLVLTHAGGPKGKSLLAGLAGERVSRIDCPAVRRFGERLDFLRGEFRALRRKADDSGLRALLDAVGTDLRELAAACSQLAADTTGVISQSVVRRYYRGRAEASGFTVADRTLEGRLPEALEQLRWALSTGTAPVLITSALAQGVRALGRVGAAGGISNQALTAQTGLPPWKIDRVRQQLRDWTPAGVARAHSAVAAADAQVKGEAASAEYALERAIQIIAGCRSGG